jgi:hypothetical protein
MGKYLEQFMSYRCAPDIIGTIGPIHNFEKEISEAFGLLKEIKSFVLKAPHELIVVDLCSGNALVPLMSTFMLPVKESIAVDIHMREKNYNKVRNFKYIEKNIHDDMEFNGRVILTACHACKGLAERIIKIYNTTKEIEYLVLSPCCIGPVEGYPDVVKDKLGKYLTWSYHLYNQVKGQKSLKVNESILSPCNAIIIAEKN